MEENKSPQSVVLGIDIDSLRVSQDFVSDVSVKRKITVVPVQRPDNSWWVRIRQGKEYQIEVACMVDKDDQRFYLLHPSIRDQLSDEAVVVRLHVAINRQGNIFLWPLRLPKEDQQQAKMERYYQSVSEGIQLACSEWVRLKWDKSLGAYNTFRTDRKLPEPEWPTESFNELIEVGFRNMVIDSMEHPIVERLLKGA